MGAPASEGELFEMSDFDSNHPATLATPALGRWLKFCGFLAVLSIVFDDGLAALGYPAFAGWSLGARELEQLFAHGPVRAVVELGLRFSAQLAAVAIMLGILGLTVMAPDRPQSPLRRLSLTVPSAFLVWFGLLAVIGPVAPLLMFGGAFALVVWLLMAAAASGARGERRLTWILALAAVGTAASITAVMLPHEGRTASGAALASVVGLAAQTQVIALTGHLWVTQGRPGRRAIVLLVLAAAGALGTAGLVHVGASYGNVWSLGVLQKLAELTQPVVLKPWATLLVVWNVTLGVTLLLSSFERRIVGVALIVLAQGQIIHPLSILCMALGAVAIGLAPKQAPGLSVHPRA